MRFEICLVALVALEGTALAAPKISGTVDGALAKTLTDAVVYIEDVPGKTYPVPADPVTIEQRQMTFIPHVLPVLVGTRVRFPNVDRVRHSVFSPSATKPFNFGIYYPRETREITFDKVGVVSLLCSIHEQMSAYVLVLQNPYFARVGADGRFTLADVPDGSHTVVLWTESGKPVKLPAKVSGAPVEVNFTK
jgi:plastocyanin